MPYTYLVLHHPKPEHRADLIGGMIEMAEILRGQTGFIDAGPWEDEGSDRIVGISRWTSKEAFLAAAPPGFGVPSTTIHKWETQPRQIFHLSEAGA
jgi:hypothetical protein